MQTSFSYWVYQDGRPVKRFVGQYKDNEAIRYASDLRLRYLQSDIVVREQIVKERVVFKVDAMMEHKAKETYDA